MHGTHTRFLHFSDMSIWDLSGLGIRWLRFLRSCPVGVWTSKTYKGGCFCTVWAWFHEFLDVFRHSRPSYWWGNAPVAPMDVLMSIVDVACRLLGTTIRLSYRRRLSWRMRSSRICQYNDRSSLSWWACGWCCPLVELSGTWFFPESHMCHYTVILHMYQKLKLTSKTSLLGFARVQISAFQTSKGLLLFILGITQSPYTCVWGWLPLLAAVGPPVTWSGTADWHANMGRKRGQG